MNVWSVVFGEQPSTTKWNYLGTNDSTLDTRTTYGWIDAGETWTRASATTFTVAGDVTAKYSIRDRIRLKQGGAYKYFHISALSYSSPNTTITVGDGIDLATNTLAVGAITDNAYSKSNTPSGYPVATGYDRVRSTKSATQSILNTTDTAVSFDVDLFDTNGIHDTSSNTTKFTAKKKGYYLCIGKADFAGNGTGSRKVYFRVNGAGTLFGLMQAANAGGGDDVQPIASDIIALDVNDYVEMIVFQSSGGALNINSGVSSTFFTMTLLP